MEVDASGNFVVAQEVISGQVDEDGNFVAVDQLTDSSGNVISQEQATGTVDDYGNIDATVQWTDDSGNVVSQEHVTGNVDDLSSDLSSLNVQNDPYGLSAYDNSGGYADGQYDSSAGQYDNTGYADEQYDDGNGNVYSIDAETKVNLDALQQDTLHGITQSNIDQSQQFIQDDIAQSNPQYTIEDEYENYEGTTGLGGLAV